MAETSLATIKKFSASALTRPENLKILLAVPEFVDGVGRCFPASESLTPQIRREKAMQLIGEAVIHITNSKAREQIQRCLASTVIESIQACGSLGLSLNTALGEAYLIPFKSVCTLMPGYRGFVRLIVNTGAVSSVESVLVYEGEVFDWRRDEHGPRWVHKPDLLLQGQAAKVVACYAVGYPTRPGAPPLFEVMNRQQLDKIQKSSKAKDSPAYKFWQTEMMRKAPIRRLRKYVARTDGQAWDILAKAEELDNRDFGVLDAEAREVLQAHSRELRGQAEQALLSPPELGSTPPPPPVAPEQVPPAPGPAASRVSEAPPAEEPPPWDDPGT